MPGHKLTRVVSFLVTICCVWLFACRVEQPEVQIVTEAMLAPTAVATPSTVPTQPAPTAEITPTPPTATPSLLPTRPTVGDFISEAGISPTGLGTDILEQRVIAFEPLNSERSFLLGYFVDTPEND